MGHGYDKVAQASSSVTHTGTKRPRKKSMTSGPRASRSSDLTVRLWNRQLETGHRRAYRQNLFFDAAKKQLSTATFADASRSGCTSERVF